MKIIYIINGFGGGGKERRLLQLIKGLSINKNISILILSVSSRKSYDIMFDMPNVEVIELANQNRIKLIKDILFNLNLYKPDIVHLWCSIPIISVITAIGKCLFRYKLIAGFIADSNPVKGFLLRFSTNIAYIVSDAVIGNSRAGIVAQKAPQNKSFVIYNGFDFTRLCGLQNITKKDFGFKCEYIVSMFARFDQCKDYDLFLRVAKKIESANENVLFLGIGHGCMLDYYKNKLLTEGINNVIFMGFRKDVEALLKISDICLLLTNNDYHAEGISNSILEAMAAGRPVIATNGGGTPEIINDGFDGFIVQPHDCNAVVDLILKLINSDTLRKQIGVNAQTRIRNDFSLEKMTNEYMKLYSKVL